jgi:hypothetical protein
MFAGKIARSKAMIPHAAILLVAVKHTAIPRIISITPDRYTICSGYRNGLGIIFKKTNRCVKWVMPVITKNTPNTYGKYFFIGLMYSISA